MQPPKCPAAVRSERTGGYWRDLAALVVVLCVLLISPIFLTAQTTAGSISGRVADPQGAAVPEASVAILNQEQNSTQHTTADLEGKFVFPVLLPGSYTVTIEAKGFKTLKKVDVVLNANSSVALGALQLQVGDIIQTVEVVAQGQEVQVDTAQRGDSVIGQQIQDIQVNGQSPMFFLRLI
ncbi:MAG TPA: carboxypeptidase-like regulatory domain-containing protein, partial [Bryobacteraceae bacterium]|nr:carboxypeptidase-like regulatory domain-containing protein [Bryobacteraceae bacterium]